MTFAGDWVRASDATLWDGVTEYMEEEKLAACRTEVFSRVATSVMSPAIGKLAARRAGAEAILAQLSGF